MNTITNSLLNNFRKTHELSNEKDEKCFELFTAYSVIKKAYGRSFELDDVLVGSGGDTGIDALAIIVNGALVNSEEEIDDLLEKNSYLDVTYVFIQAKTSDKFISAEISTFCRGVEDFFLNNYGLNRNAGILHKISLHKHILGKAVYFQTNPKCIYYYVCTGSWNDALNDHKRILEKTKIALKDADMFSDVSYKACGANEINTLYRESLNKLQASINFTTKATLPEIPNVQSAYIGILPLSEFKKLIIDDDGYVRSVFDDNIRDFQELSNPVNKTINDTLLSEKVSLFPLLNNGITIVAPRLQITGNTMILFDYQIVNGCQTSSVLAKHCSKEALKDISIPVKIIATDDEDTKNSITFATNNQTPVKREQLAALSKFQRTLEEFYNAINSGVQIVYERRSNQYASTEIPKAKIISVAAQIKSFSSMFLRNPHRVTSYYGELTKNIAQENSDIFHPNHLPLTYYLSGLAYYRLETLFRNGTIDSSNKKLRFFILFALTVSMIPKKLTKNDLTIEKTNGKVLKGLQELLFDSNKATAKIKKIVKILNESEIKFTKETLKTATTTEAISKLFSAKRH